MDRLLYAIAIVFLMIFIVFPKSVTRQHYRLVIYPFSYLLNHNCDCRFHQVLATEFIHLNPLSFCIEYVLLRLRRLIQTISRDFTKSPPQRP